MMNKRTILKAVPALMLMLAPASCGKEPLTGQKSQPIKLTVGVATRASVQTTSTLEAAAVFKMSAYTTSQWGGDGGSHGPGIYVNPANGRTLKDIDVNYASGKWTVAGNEDESDPVFPWVNKVAMNFFAYAPVSVNGTRTMGKADSSTDSAWPFHYAAAASDGVVTSGVCDDIIFAYASHMASFVDDSGSPDYGELEDGSSDRFDITFHHALSQVRFCLSTDDDTYDAGTKLVSVKVKDMVSNGDCVFQGGSFTWSPAATPAKASYVQTFNTSFNGPSVPDGWTYREDGYTKDSHTYNLYTCTGDVMFLVPQTLSGCMVEVTVQNGTEDPRTVEGELPDGTWVAGMYYTYKIDAAADSPAAAITLLSTDWIDASEGLAF